MARTIDPERYRQRRLHIIDAALTTFAENGYAATTTASICRQAGIGSGTFFHYFPTKTDVLVAILELGTQETQAFYDCLFAESHSMTALTKIVDRVVRDAADPRVPGFVQAVGGIMNEPRVAAALAKDEDAHRRLIHPWVAHGVAQGTVRTDVSTARITSWLIALFDGFLSRVAAEDAFDAGDEGALLQETVETLLRG